MGCSAVARPGANAEWERIQDLTATTAEFAARKEGADFHQFPSVPRTLVLQPANEFSPACICYAASQRGIANHVANCRVSTAISWFS
jgi:hypothetical protein